MRRCCWVGWSWGRRCWPGGGVKSEFGAQQPELVAFQVADGHAAPAIGGGDEGTPQSTTTDGRNVLTRQSMGWIDICGVVAKTNLVTSGLDRTILMRVSEWFHLGRSQPSLDFVDIDISTDITAFLDPRAIRM